jgi:uncharacterized protein YndB with AHSA1/START domain
MPGSRMQPMVIRAELATDRDATWAALTDPALVERWFTHATPVGAVGDTYELDFGGGDVMRGTVLEVVPGERLAYSWGWGDGPDVVRTRVCWDLAPGEDGTLVTLTHDGWSEAGLSAKDRDEHAAYWEGYVAALVETTDEDVAGEDA